MGQIQLHVFGGSVGESIVVGMPGNKWGIIDSYCSNLDVQDSNEAITFLKSNGITELEFLCLTHPHDDHFKGMSQILEVFEVRNFWRFAGATRERLIEILYLSEYESSASDVTERRELHRIMRMIAERREKGKLKLTKLEDIKVLYLHAEPDNTRLEIICIAPSSDAVEQYELDLRKCFEKGVLKTKIPSLNHNRISAAVLLIYGETHLVLGGDVEKKGWATSIAECDRQVRPLLAHAIKVSHHGSGNGYCDGLWERFSAVGEPHAIITPFVRHRLPTKETLAYISRFTSNVYTTSKAAIENQIDGYDFWEDYSFPVIMGLMALGHTIIAERSEQQRGRCSFVFNEASECLSVQLHGDAAKLRSSSGL